MQLLLVAVGKLRPALREVCDDYLRRLGRFTPVEEREVREAGRAASEPLQREAEGKRLRVGEAARAGSGQGLQSHQTSAIEQPGQERAGKTPQKIGGAGQHPEKQQAQQRCDAKIQGQISAPAPGKEGSRYAQQEKHSL